MPLITGNLTPLDLVIQEVASLITLKTLKEFKKSLTEKELNNFPDLADCSLGCVIAEIRETLIGSNVRLISKKSKNPWTSARAWTYGKDIYFNSRKIHSRADILRTTIHELVHIADARSPKSFGHGSNFNQDQKQLTAPMLVSTYFAGFILRKQMEG